MSLCVLGFACCGTSGGNPDVTVDAATDTADELPKFHIVDGGGDAPWCSQNPVHWNYVESCCNGAFCKGFCIENDDGGIGCSCFGIPGGCNSLIPVKGFTIVCAASTIDGGGGACTADSCPTAPCGSAGICCDPDQTCDDDAGDGGACVNL